MENYPDKSKEQASTNADHVPHEHETTNEESWIHDVNEEFGEDLPHVDEENKEEE